MKKPFILKAIYFYLAYLVSSALAYAALDYPHFGINSIGCDSCHFVYGTQPSLLPEWTAHTQVDIDDTQYNTLCWSCHNDIDAPYAKTHSSLQTDNDYGDWTVECRVCHNPHNQKQFKTYGSAGYLYSGISTGVTSATITMTGAEWTVNAYQGLVAVPNVLQKNYNYKILGNTDETLTVQGPVDLTKGAVGNTFAIVYGKLIKDVIELDDITNPIPPKTGNKTTRFFNSTGANSFADGDVAYDGVCEVCHTQTTHFRNDGNGIDQLHTNMGAPAGTNCTDCHKHKNGFQGMGGGAHPTHVIDDNGPQVGCYECHQADNIPFFKSGTDSNGDGKYELSETDVCSNCHSSDGVTTAKTYWIDDPGTWTSTDGEASFCGSCHDETPANSMGDGSGDIAPNIAGNNSTYGFYVTGHGKTSGNYARLSWQDLTATGNPAANRQCSACHNLASQHFNNATDRLKAGYGNDNNNSNCKQCHDPATIAVANPRWYTRYEEYEGSAHKAIGNLKCTACHDVHGSSGAYAGMTKNNKDALCNLCHTGHGGHDLGASFGKNSNTYSLECVSCHNVHIVSGRTSATNPGIAAMTLFTDNLRVWGDDANEKINIFAGGGKYKTPSGDTMSESQMPDYPTFCLDCHGTPQAEFGLHGGITWSGDNHGLVSANVPNGVGLSPNWFTYGKAYSWDGDDCTGTQEDCWPVIPRGHGEQIWTRPVYNQEERIAGINFVLSCSDCHETHKSDYQKLRSTVNGATYTGEWKTLCNACHYYYSDWHAGMSCGWYNSCHNDPGRNPRAQGEFGGLSGQTIHGMPHASGDGATRIWNGEKVLDVRFENNLNDSGTFRLHSKWYSDAGFPSIVPGSFTGGKSGQAVLLNGNNVIQVGTTDDYWSTDEGKHGTWKYTEMKYSTTLEGWVYPMDNAGSEYNIFIKNVGAGDGGYSFALKKISGGLRAVFNMQADNNGFTQGGKSGTRGAYSSVAVPLNKWTHIAATFDINGPDMSPDPSVGRIRIYVNGEDVTTSDLSGNNSQPGTGETSIFNYSENSPWNQGICYSGTWCASEFSIGGFPWQNRFIGKIDEVKVWNVTKYAAYFSSYDSETGPYISMVEGLIGNNQLTVRFSEGVYGSGSSALDASDFMLTDTNGDNPKTITGVSHAAGASTAVITMSQPLSAADVNADTLAAVTNAVYDEYSNAAGTETLTIGLSSQCPTSPVGIQLTEPSGSATIMDTQNILYGAVYGGAATLTGSEYSGGGDGSGRYIMFDYNTSCLQASTAMTIETRINPAGLSGTGNYIRRILARDGNGNYQISVWRNNTAYPGLYNAPSGEASIALWVYPVDAHGGNAWKPVLTNYSGVKTGSENNCPIVSDHWYQIKAVWNTDKPGGTPGQFFTPADIFIDDQGTDGAGAGENWIGTINCTDSDQSFKTDVAKFYTGDVIKTSGGENFAIGANRSNPANNLFNGLIDWITWKDTVD